MEATSVGDVSYECMADGNVCTGFNHKERHGPNHTVKGSALSDSWVRDR